MAKLYGTLLAGYGQKPVALPEAGRGVNTFVHCHKEIITLATQTTSDTIVLARIPGGNVFLYGILLSSVSLGTSVISIGNATAAAKYRAAAVFTAVETPTMYMLSAAAAATDPNPADEEVLLTIGTASLPASGTLVSYIFSGKP